MTNNPYLLAVGAASVLDLALLAILFWQLHAYRARQKNLLAGEDAGRLSEIVARQKQVLASHNKNLKELGAIMGELVEQNKLNIQKIGIVRFNPFPDTGGNISFAIALLNASKTGIVISSLHGREGTRIYAKPIEAGKSSHPLTDEERQSITEAC